MSVDVMSALTAKLLQASPDSDEFKAILLDFRQAQESVLAEQARVESERAELIEFSNQSEFIIRGKAQSVESIAWLMLNTKLTKRESAESRALHTLGLGLPETASENQKLVGECWDTMRAIKLGKQLQEESFNLDRKSLEALASL